MTAIFISVPTLAQQNREADELVKGMIEASKTLNYSGLVTYEKAGRLKTSKMLHLIRENNIFEQLIHLDGPAGQFSWRRIDENCGLGRAQGAETGALSTLDSSSFERLTASYSFEIRGQSRVAGREATSLLLKPKDNFRLPYFVAIDNQSNLMLMSVILNQVGKPLERFQFVEIQVGGDLDSMSIDDAGVNVEDSCAMESAQQPLDDWIVGWVPPEFFLTDSEKEPLTGQSVMNFSDGLSAFTVFIESVQTSKKIPPFTFNQGATTAISSKLKYKGDEFTVSVVGEIPTDSAKKIVQSVGHSSKQSQLP
ncbi:MucB/RseB C-terminal domain-containing protein [Porticoccaceae bacterium]|nr:MucB/RseB C-terminal domain-containing protein [Porticoccaceae bacterium]